MISKDLLALGYLEDADDSDFTYTISPLNLALYSITSNALNIYSDDLGLGASNTEITITVEDENRGGLGEGHKTC